MAYSYFKDTGVSYLEEDRDRGPFMIRIGGTSDFVSDVDKHWAGGVKICEGWSNPEALKFSTMDEALEVAEQVWDIEGFHTTIEATNEVGS